jgi:hypothetical protein
VPLGRRGQMTFRADRRATGLRPLRFTTWPSGDLLPVDGVCVGVGSTGGASVSAELVGAGAEELASEVVVGAADVEGSGVGVAVAVFDDDGRLTWGPSAAWPARIGLGTINATLLTVADAACAVSKMYPQAADNPPTRTLIDTRSDRMRTLVGYTGEKYHEKVTTGEE